MSMPFSTWDISVQVVDGFRFFFVDIYSDQLTIGDY